MHHLPFTILAYLLNGVSVTIDKVLISRHIPDPLIYVFYFSLVSLVALLLLPFTHFPHVTVFFLASLSTLVWTTGAYFMFKALQTGTVSRVIPLIGTLIPIFLLIHALFSRTITENETWAILTLILGIVFLILPDWTGRIKPKELIFIASSSLLFALSYLILRQAYIKESFLVVFVWSRPILIPVGLIILAVPNLRKRVFSDSGLQIKNISKATGLLFAIGQIAAGATELLLTFSISLANPVLVNSLQGIQYVFLFIFSLFLSKKYPQIFAEKLQFLSILLKSIGIIFIAIGIYALAVG